MCMHVNLYRLYTYMSNLLNTDSFKMIIPFFSCRINVKISQEYVISVRLNPYVHSGLKNIYIHVYTKYYFDN